MTSTPTGTFVPGPVEAVLPTPGGHTHQQVHPQNTHPTKGTSRIYTTSYRSEGRPSAVRSNCNVPRSGRHTEPGVRALPGPGGLRMRPRLPGPLPGGGLVTEDPVHPPATVSKGTGRRSVQRRCRWVTLGFRHAPKPAPSSLLCQGRLPGRPLVDRSAFRDAAKCENPAPRSRVVEAGRD